MRIHNALTILASGSLIAGADLQVVNPVFENNDTAVFLGLRGRIIF